MLIRNSLILAVLIGAGAGNVSIASAEQPLLARGTRTDHCVWDTCKPSSVKVAERELTLSGMSAFRYWGFRVYVATLYRPEGTPSGAPLGSYPVSLELDYYRTVTAAQFIECADAVLAKNPTINIDRFRTELAALNSLYRDVKEGDRYTLQFDGTALTLMRNGIVAGRVGDRDFAAAYLGIWLSPYSLSSSLTEDLLGQRKS